MGSEAPDINTYFENVLGPTIIGKEGSYVNDPSDPGGETNWGVTIAVARANGYKGAMKDLTQVQALAIFKSEYYLRAGLHLLAPIDLDIVDVMFDTGVNMGVGTAGTFLQRGLNVLNNGGTDYPDIPVDGMVGQGTASALAAFLRIRGALGAKVILRVVDGLKIAHYVEIANEKYEFGWIANRITNLQEAV